MTSVYGVTKYGARAQIDNQLRHNIDNFPPELVFDARAYLAEKTFECLYIMFTTNKAIQVCCDSCLLSMLSADVTLYGSSLVIVSNYFMSVV